MKIGILALQGAFIEHFTLLEKLDVDACSIKLLEHLKGIDGLIIPGGESTTMLNLLTSSGILKPLKKLISEGLSVWGICAGAICLAKTIKNSGDTSPPILDAMDIAVIRNAFGRQVDSFEKDIIIDVLDAETFPAVFIRAPVISQVKATVNVLSRLEDGTIIAARQDRLLATTFHPELTEDARMHRYFLDIVAASR